MAIQDDSRRTVFHISEARVARAFQLVHDGAPLWSPDKRRRRNGTSLTFRRAKSPFAGRLRGIVHLQRGVIGGGGRSSLSGTVHKEKCRQDKDEKHSLRKDFEEDHVIYRSFAFCPRRSVSQKTMTPVNNVAPETSKAVGLTARAYVTELYNMKMQATQKSRVVAGYPVTL